tara:strand:+ start:68 stop:1027 length:960 start_codon:yes stop_codon:yes gene_type:complete
MTFQTASVIGLGTMGHGIAQMLAIAGMRVSAFDNNTDARESLHNRIRANMLVMQSLGLLDGSDLDDVLSRVTICKTEAEALADSQFVTEAIAEDLLVKQEFFARCEDIVSEETILASNTSSFPMTSIATDLNRPERAINTHWFNPPHVIPVVEIIPGERTSYETTETVLDLFKSIGKHPVHIRKERPGFVLNRLQVALFREMLDLIEQGVISAADLDTAIMGSLAIRWAASGPMKVGDFGGWDVLAKIYEVLAPQMRSNHEVPEVLRAMVSRGDYGLKTGKGFFDFTDQEINEITAEKDRRFMIWSKLFQESNQGNSDT